MIHDMSHQPVENESGLSNFIPVLIGEREICSELQMIQQGSEKALCPESTDTQFVDTDDVLNSCQVFVSKQTAMSELLLDVGWLLKEPQLDKNDILLTSARVQSLNCLLRFLIQNECTSVLDRILHTLMNVLEVAETYDGVSKANDADIRSFQNYIIQARELVHHKLHCPERSVVQSGNFPQTILLQKNAIKTEMLHTLPSTNKDIDVWMEEGVTSTGASASQRSDIYVPLMNKEVAMDVNHSPRLMRGMEWRQNACAQFFSSSIRRSHLLVLSMAAVAVCFGICAVVSYPHEVGRFAVTMRRCLFGASMP